MLASIVAENVTLAQFLLGMAAVAAVIGIILEMSKHPAGTLLVLIALAVGFVGLMFSI